MCCVTAQNPRIETESLSTARDSYRLGLEFPIVRVSGTMDAGLPDWQSMKKRRTS